MKFFNIFSSFSCDADSSALARYVLALLKKDKPEKELKRVMIEQLDVFLVEQTKPFVERLLEAISTEEYLKTPLPTANNPKTNNEDADVASNANNNAAVANTVSLAATSSSSTSASSSYNANVNNNTSTTNTGASSASTGSNVTNVINQNDNSDTINSVTAKVIDNNTSTAATSSSNNSYADKVNTPPIDEVSNHLFHILFIFILFFDIL